MPDRPAGSRGANPAAPVNDWLSAGTGAWRQIDGGGTVQITDVDCLSPGLCVAVDNNGDVLTSTNPDGGPRDWTFTNVLPFPSVSGGSPNHFFGASCGARELCAMPLAEVLPGGSR